MFADYEEMVAQGLERQKKMNNEANDNLEIHIWQNLVYKV